MQKPPKAMHGEPGGQQAVAGVAVGGVGAGGGPQQCADGVAVVLHRLRQVVEAGRQLRPERELRGAREGNAAVLCTRDARDGDRVHTWQA